MEITRAIQKVTSGELLRNKQEKKIHIKIMNDHSTRKWRTLQHQNEYLITVSATLKMAKQVPPNHWPHRPHPQCNKQRTELTWIINNHERLCMTFYYYSWLWLVAILENCSTTVYKIYRLLSCWYNLFMTECWLWIISLPLGVKGFSLSCCFHPS